jgi:LPS-assembly lipoprotein
MSSSDPAFARPSSPGAFGLGTFGLRSAAVALAALVALGGCTIQPLYGTAPSGQAVATTIARIGISPVTDRVSQRVRNALIFKLDGGTEPSNPAYTMTLNVTSAQTALGVTPIESAPSYSLTVSATYEIKSVATGKIVLRDTSRGSASYNRTMQEYANQRAELDAENRAAEVAAEDIRLRLAVAAARGTL